MNCRVITLTGPTCAGKTTLEAALRKLPGFGSAVSHTTRSMRQGEIDGLNYHFVTDRQYSTLKDNGQFIETVEFGNARYALSADALQVAETDNDFVVIVAEPKGANQIHFFCEKNNIDSTAIWVDCIPAEQSARFVARMETDIALGASRESYASRLSAMLTDEVEWRWNASKYSQLTSGLLSYDYHLKLDSTWQKPDELSRTVAKFLE